MDTKAYVADMYLRLSKQDGDNIESDSIGNQRSLIMDFLKSHPDIQLHKIRVDDGYSGVDFNRPDFMHMIDDIRDGTVNCVIVKDLSRVGRNYIETGELLEKILPLLGVRLIAVNDGYDNLHLTTNKQLITNLKNLVNDIYAKDISRKITAAFRTRQKQGLFIGTYASYGYLKDPNDKNRIVVDPETAPIVQQIFQWKADGMGSAKICRQLTAMGVPTPNQYRLQKGIVTSAKYAKPDWYISVVNRILASEVYIGNMVQGRIHGALHEDGGTHKMIDKSLWTVVEGTHEPIISQELFQKVQAVMEERSAVCKANQGKYSHFKKPELFLDGLLFCADCGRLVYRNKKVCSGGKYVHWMYKCRTHGNLHTCPQNYIEESDLYGAVYDAIRVEIQKAVDIRNIVTKLSRERNHKLRLTQFDAEIEETEREIRRISGLRQSIFEDYASKLLTVSEYKFAVEKYEADTKRLTAKLEMARRDKVAYTASSTPENKWLAAFLHFMDAKEFSADMAKALIERVEVSDRDRVTVFFKFRDEYAAISEYAGVKK